jgi:glycosyltransferase involved in cell wall biosynthesis
MGLTVVGDPNQIMTWSGTPYFFLQAGKRHGFLHAGIPLKPANLWLRRLIWNLGCLISRGETGGFQYSEVFLHAVGRNVDCGSGNDEIVSHFPLLPPLQQKYQSVNLYIDATLRQNFVDYELYKVVGKRVMLEALARERAQYERADRIVCMSQWAAASVVEDCAVPRGKVHVIHPGASLCEDDISAQEEQATGEDELRPLRLGFVGRDWRRKGLPFLLQVVDELQRNSIPVELIVVGPPPADLPRHTSIRAVGFIDKASEMRRFIDLIRSFHFGCLASSADASPIANLECLRLGVPVVARRVGGIADTVGEDSGCLFGLEASAGEVAEQLATFVRDPSRYHQLRDRISARAPHFSWDRTVREFIALWLGSDALCYRRIPGIEP